MSSTDFFNFRIQRPELDKAWKMLEQWFTAHKERIVDPRRLVQTMDVEPQQLIAALMQMVDAGKLCPIFGVENPDTGAIIAYYNSPNDVPMEIEDRRLDRIIPSAHLRLIPMFNRVCTAQDTSY